MKKFINAKYDCLSCGHSFQMPMVGDFSYGEFILSSANEYRYLNAFENSTFQEVINIIESQPNKNQVDIQEIFGKLVCDLDSFGCSFSIINCVNCVICNSNNLKLSHDGFVWVEPVSHLNWDKLQLKEKNQKYLDFINQA